MELLQNTEYFVGAPKEIDPGNFNVQQAGKLVGLVFVFADRVDPKVRYEHWYLYEKVPGDKWPAGTAAYVFPSHSNPTVVTTLVRESDAPLEEDPSRPNLDAFERSHTWTGLGITAQYILAKTVKQSDVGPRPEEVTYCEEGLLDR